MAPPHTYGASPHSFAAQVQERGAGAQGSAAQAYEIPAPPPVATQISPGLQGVPPQSTGGGAGQVPAIAQPPDEQVAVTCAEVPAQG
jgi:hypothetical protein